MNRPKKITSPKVRTFALTLLGIAASVSIAAVLCTRLSSPIPGCAQVQANSQTVLQPISVEWVILPFEGRVVDEKARIEWEREYARNPAKFVRNLNIPMEALRGKQ
jgi:hypothetical protein